MASTKTIEEKLAAEIESRKKSDQRIKNYKEEMRKKRSHHLCEVGGLVVKAELDKMEPEVLLGAFLKIKEMMLENEGYIKEWQHIGIQVFEKDKKIKDTEAKTAKKAAQ
ncbi:MAG: conjugal transfer protein TraD [Patescibacteria group bacterium]|jgi:hypothetical protein